jgi:hypothetical protein
MLSLPYGKGAAFVQQAMQPTTFGRKIAASVILCCAPRRALICKALDGV